jgi:hypothetical protein
MPRPRARVRVVTARDQVPAGQLRRNANASPQKAKVARTAVKCPACRAMPGERCIRDDGSQRTHRERREFAKQVTAVRDGTVTVQYAKPAKKRPNHLQ